ncbi:RING finger protein 148-like [Acanthochromis polyacanthus]|uniref:RING finger protein 148-like n=1 Tax=Acanthochromis polyacanthus TaxID=80966 RepID=UPI00223486EC|nr:RING finger protein 148-like [Acanthochromis polyacanthus]
MGEKMQHCLLLVLCLSGLVQRSAALVSWTAVVEISYVNSNNVTEEKVCECGVYGRDSPLDKAKGIVTLPKGDPVACNPYDFSNRNSSSPPWIALVKRGNCTFAEKINAAKRQGAAGVVVYNEDGSGNSTTQMVHPDAKGIVAIMIGNSLGMNIVRLVKDGTEVQMLIDVGNSQSRPWMDAYWLCFLSITCCLLCKGDL